MKIENFVRSKGSPTGKSIYYYRVELSKIYQKFKCRNFDVDTYGYVMMFVEDLKAVIFPPFTRKRYIEVEPQDESSEEIIARTISPREYHIEDALWHFMDKGHLDELITSGKICFEIAENAENETKVFRYVPSYSIIKLGKFVFQYIPPSIRKKNKAPIFINLTNDVFWIKLPLSMRWNLRRMIFGLLYIKKRFIMPDFASDEMDKNRRWSNYDYKLYKKITDQLFAIITKNIGWDGRKSFNSTLEYYNIKRRMRFERFQIELREILIKGINRGLKKAYDGTDSEYSIRSTNLVSMDDIKLAESDLCQGKRDFTDIMKKFWKF